MKIKTCPKCGAKAKFRELRYCSVERKCERDGWLCPVWEERAVEIMHLVCKVCGYREDIPPKTKIKKKPVLRLIPGEDPGLEEER